MNRVFPRALAGLALSLLTAFATAEEAKTRSILVLDASGSMWGKIGGTAKIEQAREAVKQMLSGWPTGNELGLVAYGHRKKGDCTDIELIQAIGPLNAGAMNKTLAGINPKGMTPISDAVKFAAEKLKYSEQKATVILVSDGEETCNADPCVVGAELEKLGVDFTAHVVGFDLPEGKARSQLQCLASKTGGQYVEAKNAEDLNKALQGLAKETAKVKGADEWIPDVNLVPEPIQQLAENTEGTEHVDFKVEQTAKDCQALCNSRSNCAAWTYEPTGSFFIEYPRCALKSKGFAMVIEDQDKGAGWVSGVKPGVKIVSQKEPQ